MLQVNAAFSDFEPNAPIPDFIRSESGDARRMPNQKAVDAAICGSDMLSSSVTNPQRANAQSTSTSNDCSDRNGFVGSARENAVSAHRRLSDGLQQRLQAVDAFLTDILTGGNLPSFLYRCPTALQAVKTRQKSLSGIRAGCRAVVVAGVDRPLHERRR